MLRQKGKSSIKWFKKTRLILQFWRRIIWGKEKFLWGNQIVTQERSSNFTHHWFILPINLFRRPPLSEKSFLFIGAKSQQPQIPPPRPHRSLPLTTESDISRDFLGFSELFFPFVPDGNCYEDLQKVCFSFLVFVSSNHILVLYCLIALQSL